MDSKDFDQALTDLNKALDGLDKEFESLAKKREGQIMDSKDSNQTLRDLNKAVDGLGKEFGSLAKKRKREKKRKEILDRLSYVAQEMRKKGASENKVRTALIGTYEFFKVIIGESLSKSNESLLKNPEQALEHHIEIPGTMLSEVETQQIDWLWQRHIPLGKITILDGDPGMGKSLLAITIAACLSTGRPMPDDTPGRQGSTILIAPEDNAEDTIKPRIEAAGGDPSKVFLLNTVEGIHVQDSKNIKIFERPFSLSRDLEALEETIKKTKAILVVLDPLMAVLGRTIDSSSDQDVREVLTPLAQLAERTGCAILIIRHLNKGTSDKVLYRGAGSIGIIAAARTALLVAHDPDDEQKRVFATTKNNLSKLAPNLSYQVVENERGTPYIQWLGENHHATSILLRPGTNLSFERQEILRVLKDAEGPLDAREIAECTGLRYESLRSILNRMHEAREIIRPYRGKYTTPDHASIATKNAETNDETTETIGTSATSATSATSVTNPASDLASPGD